MRRWMIMALHRVCMPEEDIAITLVGVTRPKQPLVAVTMIENAQKGSVQADLRRGVGGIPADVQRSRCTVMISSA